MLWKIFFRKKNLGYNFLFLLSFKDFLTTYARHVFKVSFKFIYQKIYTRILIYTYTDTMTLFVSE